MKASTLLAARHTVFWASLVVAMSAQALAQSSAELAVPKRPLGGPEVIYRLDVMAGALVPIERADLKPDCIYNYYNERLNRRAWSFARQDGTFWYALGEGTTLEAIRFDIRATAAEARERMAVVPGLASNVDLTGRRVALRLAADGNWQVAGVAGSRTIFNAEMGERWQAHGGHWIPVVHTGGNHWTAQNGHYVAY